METDYVAKTRAFIAKRPKTLAGLVIILVLAFIGYTSWSATWTEGIKYETQLSAQYLDNQNYLSTYISSFYEQVGIARAGTDAIDKVLTDAVKGRYDNTSGGGGFAINSPMFAVMVEAYPDLSTLTANWGKIQDYIVAGRESYRNVQSKLLDQLRNYDTWRQSGVVRRFFVGILGFPSPNLKARIGATVISGTAAEDKMYQIVLTGAALDAYNGGTLDPLTIPTPVPSK